MKITWFNHCSFLLQDTFGRRILIDPYSINLCKKTLNFDPKIILLSHEHNSLISNFYKNKKITLINEIKDYDLGYIKIKGIKTYHDNLKGIKRGENIIFIFTFDHMRICYLGHLGHLLSLDTIKSLGYIDILFIPIGNHFTINSFDAIKLTKAINPKIIIPMNYKNNKSLLFLDSYKDFISYMNNIIVNNEPTFETKPFINSSLFCQTILLKEYLL